MSGVKRTRLEFEGCVFLQWKSFKTPIVFDASPECIDLCVAVKRGSALIGIVPENAEIQSMQFSVTEAPRHGYFVNVAAEANAASRMHLFGQDGTCDKEALPNIGAESDTFWLQYRSASDSSKASPLMGKVCNSTREFTVLEFNEPLANTQYVPCIILDKNSSLAMLNLMPETDYPGEYTVQCKATVTETVERDSNQVASLYDGHVIQVIEVAYRLVDGRIRARIQEPAGWISLVNLGAHDVCLFHRWAVKNKSCKRRATGPASPVMTAMWEDRPFADGMIVCESHRFEIHRGVLAASSPFFAAAFKSGMSEERTNTVEVRDASARGLQELLRFMYVGCFDDELASEILPLAVRFQIPALARQCGEVLLKKLSLETASDLIPILRAHRSDESMTRVWKEVVSKVAADDRMVRLILEQ